MLGLTGPEADLKLELKLERDRTILPAEAVHSAG